MKFLPNNFYFLIDVCVTNAKFFSVFRSAFTVMLSLHVSI